MKPRIEMGKSMSSYLKAPGESASLLKQLALSPLHYQQAKSGQYAQASVALAKGSAFHALMEGEDVFRNQYVISPKLDKRTKVGKEAHAALQEEHASKIILSPEDMAELLAMRDSVLRIPEARHWIESFSMDREVNVFWKHSSSGLLCKARADLWDQDQGVVLDYKTCQDASPDGFERAVKHWSYLLSAVHYQEGTQWERYGWICVEKLPPYAACFHWLEPGPIYSQLEVKRDRLLNSLVELNEVYSHQPWPSYGENGVNTIRM